jgi:hypothetical protein
MYPLKARPAGRMSALLLGASAMALGVGADLATVGGASAASNVVCVATTTGGGTGSSCNADLNNGNLTIVGAFSGNSVTGSNNTGVGESAANSVTGSNNTAVGYGAGNGVGNGLGGVNDTISIGFDAKADATNAIAIGPSAEAVGQGTVSIGNNTGVHAGAGNLENTAVGDAAGYQLTGSYKCGAGLPGGRIPDAILQLGSGLPDRTDHKRLVQCRHRL